MEANKKLVTYNQTLREENLKFRQTISKIEAITGKKLMNYDITEDEMSQLLRPTTRRNSWDDMLNNVMIYNANPIKRSVSR